jgi:hypothetical protein
MICPIRSRFSARLNSLEPNPEGIGQGCRTLSHARPSVNSAQPATGFLWIRHPLSRAEHGTSWWCWCRLGWFWTCMIYPQSLALLRTSLFFRKYYVFRPINMLEETFQKGPGQPPLKSHLFRHLSMMQSSVRWDTCCWPQAGEKKVIWPPTNGLAILFRVLGLGTFKSQCNANPGLVSPGDW